MNWKRSLPSGSRDKLFRAAAGAFTLEQKVCQVFKTRGYQRIETPVIEFEDVFRLKTDLGAEHYRFFDRKGRLLTLRPDMTLPIGRVVATTGVTPPLKLFYSGKIFRSSDEMLGEQNEQTQAGIEIIGYSSVKAEVECLLCAGAVLAALAITDYHIELGHATIYQEMLRLLQLSEKDAEHFHQLLADKSITGLRAFVVEHPSSLDDFICHLPFLFGEVEKTIEQARELTDNPVLLQAFADMLQLKKLVDQSGKVISLTVDMGMTQALSYYTGLIFRGYADLIPEQFLSGGRYDGLSDYFDDARLPAVGMGLNLDILIDLQYRLNIFPKPPVPATLIHYDLAALQAAEELHQQIADSVLSLFDDLEESIDFARLWGYQQVIEVSPARQRIINLKEPVE